jgi:hypothetical protein
MPKGGPRTVTGRPVDPNSLRQAGKAGKDGWVTLPAEGRKGDPPPFPLPDLHTEDEIADIVRAERELDLWRRLWAMPQAVVWERQRCTQDVAMYVRIAITAESGDIRASQEARQYGDRLGLNPAAMMRNRWRIAEDEVGRRREERAASSAESAVSMRDRLRAVNDEAA